MIGDDLSQLRLVVPTASLHESWLAAREEFGPGAHLDGCGLRKHDEVDTPAGFAAWTARLRAFADPATAPPPGLVRSTYRWIAADDTYLGGIDLRHELSDFLLQAGGHIGYSVRPTARRQGLATWALGQTLHSARGLGLERVLLTCDPGNEASVRTIEANGGQLEDVRATSIGPKRRYWITLAPPAR